MFNMLPYRPNQHMAQRPNRDFFDDFARLGGQVLLR